MRSIHHSAQNLSFLLVFLTVLGHCKAEEAPAENFEESVFAWAERLGYTSPNQNCLAKAQVPEKPNVILIIVDDAQYTDFGAYQGNKKAASLIQTPWIDSIARNGVRFSNAYVASPLCSPSRAALMTARPHWQNQVQYNVHERFAFRGLPQSEKTIAEYMKEKGYTTTFIGKWHLGAGEEFHAKTQGFDHYWLLRHGDSKYFPPYRDVSSNIKQNKLEQSGHPFYLTDKIALEALDFMDKQQKKAPRIPFYITLSFTAPHFPLQAKSYHAEQLKHVEPSSLQTYLAMIMALDEAVGVLLSYLNHTGLCNDTLLLFINDNGGTSSLSDYFTIEDNPSRPTNWPLQGAKGEYKEGGIRVPFMMQWIREVPRDLVYEHMVSSYDILPTAFLGAAKGEFSMDDPSIVGVNLLPKLSSQEAAHECLFWVNPYSSSYSHRVLRCGVWKLDYSTDGAFSRLYNLETDVGERQDLLLDASEESLNKAAELEEAMEEWLDDTEFYD